MTISTTASRISYNGNGATVAFSFPYRFLANRDIVVVLRSSTGSESILLLGTHYTLSGAGGDAGGTVTMAVAPAIGERLVIYRSVAITQETDYISGDPFPAETHEQALDRLTMIDQQQQDSLDRTLRFPVSDTVSPELPTQAVRANKLLAFDALGNPTTAVPMTDSSTDVRLDLAASTGAAMVGANAYQTQAEVNAERVTPEQFGADGVDDTDALQAFFDAIAAGKKGEMQPRVYKYNRAVGGVLSADCARFVLNANGATIQCTAYPSAGASTIIDFVNVRADYLHMVGLEVDGGWQLVGGRVGSYCTSGGFFNYMHGLVLSADAGFVDAVTVHDCEGLGVTTEGGDGLKNVQIGSMTVHHNWMIGADLRSLGAYVEDVNISQILAYENGTRGVGWVQVNIGDNKATSGSRRILIGQISANDGGGTGVGVGQYANPANGDTSGAVDIYIGSILAKGNIGHGVELYASVNCHVSHINATGNGKKGVYFERSDTNNLFSYAVSVGEIKSTLNGEEGVLLSGGSNYQVQAITAWNNGTSGAGFAGCKLYSANLPAQEMGHVQIGMLRCFDDRSSGSKTQDYGLSITYFGQPFDFTHIGSADLSDNKSKDLVWEAFGNSKPVSFDELSYGTVSPSYADVSHILLVERGEFKQKWRTTNATPIAPLVCKPTQGIDCVAVCTVVGRDSGGTVTHYGKYVDAYKWTGTGHTKVAAMQALESKSGATQAYSNDFGSAVGGYVQGLAGTTIDWDVSISFSAGFDKAFAI